MQNQFGNDKIFYKISVSKSWYKEIYLIVLI